MIRIDALWLCTQPQDMRAGADRLLAVVVNTVGQAQAQPLPARLFFQQHGNTVTHRVGQARAARHQLLAFAVVSQRAFGDGADQQFEQFRVHGRQVGWCKSGR